MPTVGAPVTVAYLGRSVGGVIEEVEDEGRRLVVAAEDGTRFAFVLSRATGQFVREGDPTGARLSFDVAD
jgi:hypothetical protein